MPHPTFHLRRKHLSVAVALAVAALATAQALAQQAAQPTAPAAPGATTATTATTATAAPADVPMATVIVSTRRSQQSAIQRKKNAATAQDSIVAEDVGTLPDRNIGEAISRIAGVAIDRGDFGEGTSV
ncbi:MAG: hypothetical protein JF615_12560, partial [Asticcacaulis sp.]|nr:hypothetical protein [Asticcacaulis sp.]